MSKYKFQSQITGEITTNIFEVIKIIIADFKGYNLINFKWKYNKKGF